MNTVKLFSGGLLLTATIAASLAMTAMSPEASAQTPSAQHANKAFAKLDTNGDGMISRSEAAVKPKLAAHFDQIDTNKDGLISVDELAAARQKHQQKVAAKFAKLDTDNDGRISRNEASAAPKLAKNFDAIDTNKDGFLSKGELKAAHQRLVTK